MIDQKTLRGVLPDCFFTEFSDAKANKYLDVKVVKEYNGRERKWPGKHKNVFTWWLLENGHAVGWNENPAIGYSFPSISMKNVNSRTPKPRKSSQKKRRN